ncbi:hypothetical protein BC831DRAFT_458918 [Entophlyctis helioformis]|nr:hypothetical protein BC831DRAFT_458918 [Entophlyctis helioformis]
MLTVRSLAAAHGTPAATAACSQQPADAETQQAETPAAHDKRTQLPPPGPQAAARPVTLTPLRVAMVLVSDHRALELHSGDTKYARLSEPFVGNARDSNKKIYLDHCFGPSASLPDVYAATGVGRLVARAVQGGSSGIVTARLGRIPSIPRYAMHLEALRELRSLLESSQTQHTLHALYVGFTDNKCIDMITEAPINAETLAAESPYRAIQHLADLEVMLARGCSLPFIVSVRIEAVSGERRTLGSLDLVDLGMPSFQKATDKSPVALPRTMSVIRDIAGMIATPGAAGLLPLRDSFLTLLAPELFGGCAETLHVLHVDPSDPACATGEVQPAIEFCDLLRKVRNQTSVSPVDPRVPAYQEQARQMESKAQLLFDQIEVERQRVLETQASLEVQLKAAETLLAASRLDHDASIRDLEAMCARLESDRLAADARAETNKAAASESLRSESMQNVMLRHDRERVSLSLAEKTAAFEKLARNYERLQTANNHLQDERDVLDAALAEQTDRLKRHLSETEIQTHAHSTALDEAESRIFSLEQVCSEQEQDYDAAQKRIAALSDHIEQLESTSKALGADLKTAKTAHAELRDKYQSVHEALQVQTRATIEASTRYEDLEMQYRDLTDRFVQSKAQSAAAKADLESQVAALQAKLADERKEREAERLDLAKQAESSRDMEARWEARLQQSLAAMESRSSGVAVEGRQREIEALQASLNEARKEQQAFIEQALSRERGLWAEERATLIQLIASKADAANVVGSGSEKPAKPAAKRTSAKPKAPVDAGMPVADKAVSDEPSAKSKKGRRVPQAVEAVADEPAQDIGASGSMAKAANSKPKASVSETAAVPPSSASIRPARASRQQAAALDMSSDLDADSDTESVSDRYQSESFVDEDDRDESLELSPHAAASKPSKRGAAAKTGESSHSAKPVRRKPKKQATPADQDRDDGDTQRSAAKELGPSTSATSTASIVSAATESEAAEPASAKMAAKPSKTKRAAKTLQPSSDDTERASAASGIAVKRRKFADTNRKSGVPDEIAAAAAVARTVKVDKPISGLLSFLSGPSVSAVGTSTSASGGSGSAPEKENSATNSGASGTSGSGSSVPVLPRLPKHVLDKRRLARILGTNPSQ